MNVLRSLPSLLVPILVFFALPIASRAQDAGDWGSDVDADEMGFAEATPAVEPAAVMSPLLLKGFFKYRFGVWVERDADEMPSTSRFSTDLSLNYKTDRLKGVAGLRFDHDSVYLLSQRGYDEPTKKTYGNRLFLQETFLAYTAPNFEVSVGRQSVAWGEGDALSPSDVVTPYDQREFGLAELDDIRRPRLLSRVNWHLGKSRLELIVGHEAYYGERPTPRSEYSPLRFSLEENELLSTTLGDKALSFESQPEGYGVSGWDYFGRWVYNGEGIDLGVSVARFLDRQGVLVLPDVSALAAPSITMPLEHRTLYQVAQTGAKPFDAWLVKWESVFNLRESINTGAIDGNFPQINQAKINRFTQMIGLTYSGFSQLTMGAEFQRSFLLTRVDDSLFPLEMSIVSGRIVGNFLRERLRLIMALSVFGVDPYQGYFSRVEGNYELRDGFRAGLMYVHYNPASDGGLSPLTGLDQHDQILAQLRWDFQY